MIKMSASIKFDSDIDELKPFHDAARMKKLLLQLFIRTNGAPTFYDILLCTLQGMLNGQKWCIQSKIKNSIIGSIMAFSHI
jgi:hypothetical protein